MTRDEIRTGMFVETASGTVYEVKGQMLVKDTNTWANIEAWDEDLTVEDSPSFAIIKVYDENHNLIWERPMVEISMEEISYIACVPPEYIKIVP